MNYVIVSVQQCILESTHLYNPHANQDSKHFPHLGKLTQDDSLLVHCHLPQATTMLISVTVS